MTEESGQAEVTVRRSVEAIFEDLQALARTEGSLHCLTYLNFRDWIVTVDLVEHRIKDEPERRWSTSKLNKNELMLLTGLVVQSPASTTYTELPSDLSFVEAADRLLSEFHDRLRFDFPVPGGPSADTVEGLSALAREAIYYGAECFYVHQFEHFSRHRYRRDGDWLLANVGISIRPILEIARYILDRTSAQMTSMMPLQDVTDPKYLGELTGSLCIPKADLRRKFGGKVEAFLSKFSIPAQNANAGFDNPFAINDANTAPIIDLGDFLYLSNGYRLFETIYESPFYWMMADTAYLDVAADHRGQFLESTAAHLLREVFGPEHVFENVTIQRNRRETAGEADVLVVYGEFVIIVQAKSKRLTQRARAGDAEALVADFEGAIQAPYRQAYEFAELIEGGAEAVTKDGEAIVFAKVVRAFPAVILSDGFPASTLLSSLLLQRSDRIAPVIWDLGVLDCVISILPTPVELLFYLKARSDAFGSIMSDSEYNFLGFHLRHKLVLAPDIDVMMIDRDYATIVDDFMIARDLKLNPEHPIGILERVEIPVVSDLLRSLKSAPPDLASVVIDLYDLSSAALEDISRTVLNVREEVGQGKVFKAFSLLTASGGLTYLVCAQLDERTRAAAEDVGTKHKYDQQRDRWYVLVDSNETTLPIDALVPLLGPWQEDPRLAETSRQVAELYGSRLVEVTIGAAARDDGDKGEGASI